MTPSRFGLSVAISTPFDRTGALDIPRLVDHAQWCLLQGCDSVTLFGTTGEGASVGLSTRGKVFDAVLTAGIKPKQLLSSVVASAIEDAADQATQALDLGFRGLLLTPPFYFREIGEDALFGWFAQLFHRLGPKARDMFAYHLPSVTGVPLSVALIGRLKREFPGVVVGVKDSSATWSNTAALLEQHSDLMILVGDERDLAKAVRMNDLVVLTAPEDGIVLEVAKRSVGSVLREAEPLVTMVPTSAPLIAEVMIDSADVGYTKLGDEVAIKVDAFPYQRHGLLEGRLRAIGEDSVSTLAPGTVTPAANLPIPGVVHRSQVALDDGRLHALPEGTRLIPGMTLTAEIKVGSRSVISYFLYPLMRAVNEAIREP